MRHGLKKMENIQFQFCATPDSMVLELIDENEDAFLDIEYDEEGCVSINFYKTEQNISVPIEIIKKGIKMIEEKILTN